MGLVTWGIPHHGGYLLHDQDSHGFSWKGCWGGKGVILPDHGGKL